MLTPRVQALLAAELDRYEWRPHLRIAPGDRTTTPFGGAPTQGWWAPGWLQIMENDRCTAGINAPRPTEARVGTPWHVPGWRTRVGAAVETFFSSVIFGPSHSKPKRLVRRTRSCL